MVPVFSINGWRIGVNKPTVCRLNTSGSDKCRQIDIAPDRTAETRLAHEVTVWRVPTSWHSRQRNGRMGARHQVKSADHKLPDQICRAGWHCCRCSQYSMPGRVRRFGIHHRRRKFLHRCLCLRSCAGRHRHDHLRTGRSRDVFIFQGHPTHSSKELHTVTVCDGPVLRLSEKYFELAMSEEVRSCSAEASVNGLLFEILSPEKLTFGFGRDRPRVDL